MPATVTIGDVIIGPGRPLAVIAGPCVIESRDHTLHLADAMLRLESSGPGRRYLESLPSETMTVIQREIAPIVAGRARAWR